MFSRLKNWLSHHSQQNYDLYKPVERNIYSYFDGQKMIQADPIRLYKRLMDKGPDIDIDRKVASSQSKDAVKAHGSLIRNIAEVFNVKSLEEGGLTDSEVTELLDHFLTYLDSQKKITPTLPTSLTNSAASGPCSAEPPATGNSSACGSTRKEAFTVRPRPSPSESVSPREAPTPA